MVDVRLRTTEKNEVFRRIEHLGLSPSEFAWQEKGSNEWRPGVGEGRFRCSVLIHRPSGYFFRFGGFSVTFSPGLTKRNDSSQHKDTWHSKRDIAYIWLEELRKDVLDLDLWASIGQEKVLSTAASSADLNNRPFTASERSFIAVKLDELKAYVLEGQQFNSGQAEFVEREFADLKESSRRFGRKDWLRVLLGVLIGQLITLALAPEKANGLLRLAGVAFQSLWGIVQGYLP